MADTVKIDGAEVKGGGQVLRNAVSYAAILGKIVHFVNVRASRRRPGLRPQYIEGLEVVAKLSNSTLVNAHEGSQEISFNPRELHSTHLSPYEIHTKHAATSLLLQASLPVLLLSPHTADLVLTGGTDALISPSIDYMQRVLVPLLRRHFHIRVEVEVARRDCMPRGKALVTVRTHPAASLPAISLRDRGCVARVSGLLYGYGKTDPGFVAAAEMALRDSLREIGINIDVEFGVEMQGSDTDHPLVCRALVCAETSTGCILGGGAILSNHEELMSNPKELMSNPTELMSSAVRDLGKQLAHGGCTDEYLQDQLVIFMALADGVSEIVTGPVTEHTKDAIRIAERMTDARFSVIPVAGGGDKFEIRCEGIRHMSRPSRQQILTSFLTCAQVHEKQDFGDMFKHVNAT